MEAMSDVAKRIRAWRRHRGLTVNDLAAPIGVTAPAIHQWESGTTEPTLANVGRLVKTFRTDLATFFGPLPRSRRA